MTALASSKSIALLLCWRCYHPLSHHLSTCPSRLHLQWVRRIHPSRPHHWKLQRTPVLPSIHAGMPLPKVILYVLFKAGQHTLIPRLHSTADTPYLGVMQSSDVASRRYSICILFAGCSNCWFEKCSSTRTRSNFRLELPRADCSLRLRVHSLPAFQSTCDMYISQCLLQRMTNIRQ